MPKFWSTSKVTLGMLGFLSLVAGIILYLVIPNSDEFVPANALVLVGTIVLLILLFSWSFNKARATRV